MADPSSPSLPDLCQICHTWVQIGMTYIHKTMSLPNLPHLGRDARHFFGSCWKWEGKKYHRSVCHTWMRVEGVHGTTGRMERAVGYLPLQILISDLNLPVLETTLQPFWGKTLHNDYFLHWPAHIVLDFLFTWNRLQIGFHHKNLDQFLRGHAGTIGFTRLSPIRK